MWDTLSMRDKGVRSDMGAFFLFGFSLRKVKLGHYRNLRSEGFCVLVTGWPRGGMMLLRVVRTPIGRFIPPNPREWGRVGVPGGVEDGLCIGLHRAWLGRNVLRPYGGADHFGGAVISMAQMAAGRMYIEAR
jgi:hypothetical protein